MKTCAESEQSLKRWTLALRVMFYVYIGISVLELIVLGLICLNK